MSRTLRFGALAVLMFVAGSGSARADWWVYSGCSPSYYGTSFYYPIAPVYYVSQPAAYLWPAPQVRPAPGAGYAQPQPAPPSQDTEPAPEKKKTTPPKVSETQSSSKSDFRIERLSEDGDGKASYRVGFWNVTGRDLKLTVSGKTYHVPRDRSLTLMVGRTFSWGIDSNHPQEDRVPDDRTSHEIVIR
jgi:hypothetical protein